MTTWILLLKKARAEAKSRLAEVMPESARRALVERLFHHDLDMALHVDAIARVAVISPERPDLPENVLWIRDISANLNASICQGIGELVNRGADRILILPSDLPHLTESDLAELVKASAGCDMVIAPDDRESGTNALLLASPEAFQPCFGLHSYRLHLEQARKLGWQTRIVRRPGLGFDLDDKTDWERYRDANQPGRLEKILSS